jgi:hypothetical protein
MRNRKLSVVLLVLLLCAAGPAAAQRVFTVSAPGTQNAKASEPPPQRLATSHPRLFFTSAELNELRARAKTTHRAMAQSLFKWADAHANDKPPLEMGGGLWREQAIFPDRSYDSRGTFIEQYYLPYITNFSLAYLLSGKPQYERAAKDWLLTLCRMPEWEGTIVDDEKEIPDRGLYTAFALVGVAASYDWLHDRLSVAQRQLVRDKLASKLGPLYDATFAGEWWTGAYLHHDHTIPVVGLGIGALALLGEHPKAEQWAARALDEIKGLFARLGTDGAWHEGPGGWAFDMTYVMLFLDAERRVQDISLWDQPWLKRTSLYRLHLWLPNDEFIAMDDAHRHGEYHYSAYTAAHVLRRLAAEYHDGHAQWLAGREAKNRPNPYTLPWEIIWYDPTVKPTPPNDLPPTHFFENEGIAIMRTGWGAKDWVFSFSSSSRIGRRALDFLRRGEEGMDTSADHSQADQNSFTLYALGQGLIVSPEYGSRGTQHQNSILVDGQGQLRLMEPKAPRDGEIIQTFFSPSVDVLTGDATRCYPEKLGLRKFLRHVAFFKPNYVVIFDELAATEPREFEWREQANNIDPDKPRVDVRREMYLMRDDLVVERGDALLKTRVLLPRNFQYRIGESERTKYVAVTAPSRSARAEFLTVLNPTSLSDQSLISPIKYLQAVAGHGLAGARIGRGGKITDYALFKADDARIKETNPGTLDSTVESDASFILLSLRPKQELVGVTLVSGTKVSSDGKLFLKLDKSGSIALNLNGLAFEGVAEVPNEGATLEIVASGRPMKVTVEGRAIDFRFDEQTGRVSFRLPGGRSTIRIELQR